MKKRLLRLTMLLVTLLSLPSGAWADTAYGTVRTWNFTWSEATKNALQDVGYWTKENSNFWYQVPMTTASPLQYGETDLAQNLTFLTGSGITNRIGISTSALMVRRKSTETVKIVLPSLSVGNLIEITSSSTDSKSIEIVGVTESTIETKVSPSSTTSEQTYSYKILQAGVYELQVATTNSSGTDLVSINSITIYADEGKSSTTYQWNSWLTDEQVTEMAAKFNKWVYSSAGYYPYSKISSSQSLKINEVEISEVSGLTFLNSAKNSNLRIGANNAIQLVKNTDATIEIPVTYANSKVTIVTSQGEIVDAASTNAITPEVSSKTYVFNDVPSGTFSIKSSASPSDSKDARVTSITVEAPYGVLSGSFTNGNVTWTSEGNAVTGVDNAFFAGSTISLTVNPAAGFQLKENTLRATYNNGSEQELAISENSFTMPAYDVTVSAEFESTTPAVVNSVVTFNTSPTGGTVVVNNGTADIETGTEVGAGANVTITATPSRYYSLGNISVTKTDDQTTIVPVTNNTFTMPAYPVTISATFVSEELVGTLSTWTFNDLSEQTYTTSATQIAASNTGGGAGYFKSHASATARQVTIEGITETEYAFSNGVGVTVSKIAKFGGKINSPDTSNANVTGATAGNGDTGYLVPTFAFNATVAGTVYVLMKGDVFACVKSTGTSATREEYATKATGAVDAVSFSVAANTSVFIGDKTSACDIYAIRFVPTRTITIASMSNGEVTADKTAAGDGDKITLTVTPAAGYQLATLQANSVDVTKDSNNEYTFTMPDEDVTITATFTEVPSYEVTKATSIENGDIQISPASAAAGETITLTILPSADYVLKAGTLKYTTDGGTTYTAIDETTCTFTMPSAAATVTAEFERVEVNTTKNWIFNELTTNSTYSAVTPVASEYYLRGSSESPNRNFTVKDLSESIQLTFADGISVNATKLLEANGQIVTKVSTDNDVALTATSTAGDATKCGMSTFAFNAGVAGTCYAKVKYTGNTSTSVRHRIYFANGSTITNNSIGATSGIDEVSFTSTEAGSFFIGDISGSGKFEIYAVRFVPTSEAVKYTLSVSSVEHATITAKVGETTITEGENADVIPGSTVTLTAVPDAGYQLVGWKDGSNAALGAVPQSLITTTAMTPAAMTVSATISAQSATPTAITSETTWTFDSFTAETALSGTKPYEYNGLYINGHNSDNSNLATIKNGSASNDDFGGSAINATKYVYVAGNPSPAPTTTTTVNSFIKDAVAFRAGVPGTVYVLMSGVYVTNRTFDVYVNGVNHPTNQDSGNAAIIVSQEITEAANVFIATSGGAGNIYAVKFVPAPTYAVSAPISVENGQVGVDKASAYVGETVTITVTPANGYRLKSGTLKATYNNGTSDVELEITNNQFTMPAYAVTVTAQFEALPAIYGTYDFRTFATDNIEFVGENTNVQATVELQNGVMTGKFTYDDPTKGTVTDNTMELNDAFSATNVQLRKKKNTPASTALLLPNSSTAQLTINRLRAGDWFVIETEAESKLLVKTANANISKLGSSETLAANETIESGVKYLVSAATSIDLYNNNVANAHIYTITISKDEAIADPAIGDLNDGKVTITPGVSTASGTLKTYYTLDGSTPSASSTEYTAAVTVDQTRFVKAITINTTTSVASNVVTKKIVVDAATPATTWDFLNDETLATVALGEAMGITGSYYTNSNQSNSNFINITNAPIHSKLSWLLPNLESVTLSNVEGQGLKDTSYRAFTINDLHKGDKIYITYSGGDLNVSAHTTNGNKVTADGTAVNKGSLKTFASGAEIDVTEVDATYNYVAFKASSKDVVISKIEINPVYQITGVKGTGISTLAIKTPSEKTFDDSFARGTKVTLKATTTLTGGAYTWTDGDGNVLTPATSDGEGELTITLTANTTVNVSYSNAKIWDFSELPTGSISTVSKSNGMYYLVNSAKTGRTVTINEYGNTAYTWNFPDGTSYSRAANTGNYAVVPGNGDLAPVDNLNPEGLLDKQDTDDKYNRALAFTTTQAGTVYVAFQGASSNSEFTGRYYKLFFKPASGSSYEEVFARDANIARTANSRLDVLYYTASEPGTFVIGGGAAMNIYYVKFEPTDAANIVTLTETASPEGSGSVKREIVYGETPNYYETPASTFIAGTKLRLTPAANVGYGFTYWGDNADDTVESKTVTMTENQSVKVNFEEVKHQVTVAAAENGTVVLKVGDEIITPTDGKAEVGEGAQVTLLARPNLSYTMSGVTVAKTDDATTTVEVTNGKFTIPAYDVTITPTFTAEKSISEGKTWTFSTAEETTNTITDFGEGLYLRAGSKAFTKVESGSITSVTLGGETINVSSALQTPSSFTAPDDATTSATVVSPINSAAGVPMIAVNAASKGTIYVATSPVADGSGQTRIYFGNGTEKPAQMVNPTIAKAGEVYTTSYTTYAPGTFYIGTTVAANIYAVKFVPLASSDGVTLTQDGTNYVLSNGKVTAVINEKGQVDQLLTEDGKYVIKAGSAEAGCLDYTSNGSNRELQKGSEALTVTKVKETSDMVELRFTNDQNSLAQTWSIGYIMRKDVSGLYTYATMEGAKDGAYQEARLKWRPNASFNYAWVSDDVQGQMPPYNRLVDDYKVQDATFTLADGTIYTKYDWANYMKDDLLHGVMNTTNGAWAIAPNMEWMNGGVQKQELTVHADNKGPVLLQMLQGEHFGASAYTAAVGSKQFYGPTLLYINSGETKEAMIADAKQQAAKEVEAWPYSWFSHDDYPTAADRATVTGTITLNKDDFSTTKLQVILADASTDEPLQQSGGYQYATEVTSTNGSYAFTIKNVRPGNYALFAYALDGDATGLLKSSKSFTIAKGSNNVGTVAWTPAKYKTKLWQIGEADRTTSGFKLSDHKRQYGMWDGSVVADAGIPTTLTYTIGTSTESDWYYAQTKDNSTWTVKFNNTETYAEPLHLTIAVAGSSRKPTLTVNMNDTEVYKAAYPNSDGALYRSGVLSGRSGLIEIEIPAAAMKVGENNLTLLLSGGDSGVGGLLYDCIKLEAGESEVEDLGNRLWDFSEWTFDEGATKKNLTEVTNSKNLYYRAGPMNDTSDGRSIAINKNTVGPFTWNFPDGETYTRAKNVGNYATLPGNGTLAPANDLTPATKLGESLPGSEDSNNRSLAFTTTKAGTLYVAFRGTENRDYQVFFKPASGESYNLVATSQVDAADSKKGILFYTASEGGHFLIGGAAAMTAYLIKFEPAETTYKLTANVQPANCGTVKKDIVYTVDGAEKTYATTDYATVFLPGTKLSLTAVANGSNTFKGWDDTTETGSKIITMTADQTVTANFNKVTFSATYLPETIYQEEGEFTFDTETTVSVWTAEKNSTSGEWEAKRRSDYQYLTNMDTNKVSVRVGAQSITYGEDNSIRLSRPMAIHNLDVDDEITILYAGSGSLASVTTAEGDDFTIDGTEAEAGKAIPSGALLKVTGISTGDNYVVVGPVSSSPIYIKGIYINTKAPEFLHTPTVELKAVDGETAIYTISYDEGATLHYQLSTEENEQEGDTSGAFDLNITESAKMTAWTTKGDLKSENLETTIFAPTPAPSEDGNFDFSEASEDLPADMEVTLDETHPVTVEGETFYKPSPLTAATFDDKFAFSETTTSDKIKIRTNRQLVFAKGTDMDMAILNLKRGDIIAFDYSGGTMEFSASDIITTDQSSLNGSRRAVAANETVISGENYVVTGEGDLILHLKLTTTAVNIAKMALTKVAKPSAPKALDFATTQEEEETLEEGHAVTVYYNGQDTSQRFFRLNNNSEWLPAEGKISTPTGKAGLTTGGLKIDRNRFAIHDLAVGDTIKIRFYGGELTFEGHATKGDKIKVKSTGAAIEPGAAMESGVTIVVDKVDYLNNYLVFMLDKTCVVSGIFINKKETEKIIAPSLRDRGNGTLVQITPGRSTMDREVFTCYTTDGTDPSMVNGTSGIMTDVFDLEIVELHDCDVLVKAISYSRDGAISKMVEVTVQVTGIITDISGVPTIDGKPATIYDLRGHRVTTMMKGQIYIINGKKYLYK